jgi:hypothetical protein
MLKFTKQTNDKATNAGAALEICESRNYKMFAFKETNRPVNSSGHKYEKLKTSMATNGWIPAMPLMVTESDAGYLIDDGQHRFTCAVELGIPVLFVVVENHYNVPKINECFRAWTGDDYVHSHAASGNKHFILLKKFMDRHGLKASRAANLLAAKNSFMCDSGGSVTNRLRDGSFVYSELGEAYAEQVLKVADGLPTKLKTNRSANAAIARVLLLDDVCPDTLKSKLEANAKEVTPRSDITEYLQMLEYIYNKRNRNKLPILIMLSDLRPSLTK